MTAKEKALELINKYQNIDGLGYFRDKDDYLSWNTRTIIKQTKQCAIIAIDEIIDNVRTDYHDHQWYRQVKQEIEKL